MSKSKLFIPQKIKVGYQKRDDTYNGKLSYIIYFDEKGKLRKEASWESWRAKDIDPEEYSNEPMSGFVLHKDVKRYNWDHFSSKRTLIRVFDPRGMEFEITTDNLLFILQNTDCVKRELAGEFVYSWLGPELILLPKNTEEYNSSANFTNIKGLKFSSKSLVPGRSYKTKDMNDRVYVGYEFWHDWDRKTKVRVGSKEHIFYGMDSDNEHEFKPIKNPSSVIRIENSPEIVSNYAEIVDKFNNDSHSRKIASFELKRADIDLTFSVKKEDDYYPPGLIRSLYFVEINGVILQVQIEPYFNSSYEADGKTRKHSLLGYKYSMRNYAKLNPLTDLYYDRSEISWFGKNGLIPDDYHSRSWYYRHSYVGNSHNIDNLLMSADEIKSLNFYDLYIKFENGKKIKINKHLTHY